MLTRNEPLPTAVAVVPHRQLPALVPADEAPVMVGAGVPVRISIPSISLAATVEPVALTEDGAMGVPEQPLDTGWYSLGTRPGDVGSAAITGHVDWLHGATAVFANLHKVRPGDKIEVQDDGGKVVSFVVRESKSFSFAADAREVFSSSDGRAHLNIITCEGKWDKKAKQYAQRLVVFADRESEPPLLE